MAILVSYIIAPLFLGVVSLVTFAAQFGLVGLAAVFFAGLAALAALVLVMHKFA